MPQAIFRKHETKVSLFLPEKTCLASTSIIVNWLLQVKKALEQCIPDGQWIPYVTNVHDDNKQNIRIISSSVKNTILEDEYLPVLTHHWYVGAPDSRHNLKIE